MLSTPDAGTGPAWYAVLGSESALTVDSEGGSMKKIGVVLAGLAGVVALTSSANAADCLSIADPMKRLACYDKAASAATRSAKPTVVDAVWTTPANAVAATPIVKGPLPVRSDPRYWFEAEGGFFGAIRNVQNAGPTAPGIILGTPVPTSPGSSGSISSRRQPRPPTARR